MSPIEEKDKITRPGLEQKRRIKEVPRPEFELEKEKIEEAEKRREVPLGPEKEVPGRRPVPLPPTKPVTPPVKSETRRKIEQILSEDLTDIYQSLDEEHKRMFKKRGEEVASKIEQMVSTFRVKVKEVLNLIKEWLKLIPQVNRFFLEQEAKIKTDKIVAFSEKKKKESQGN